ncbi:uncharacterized protein LOC116211428 [Punica granatum]|uniref:Uncharacterized protein LOC116211428 n=2 Tax=Punica granatum TaxID=22663 RepID=A0A6P8E251_PUNGR|nr:uncharacterized protein LOC116211428 [Punica granatum]PKI66940.1 hypothetical protein CRG98_012703 [Punica granatum]
MDNESIMKKDKLGFGGILGQSLKITATNPKFLIFTLLTSFPLFLSLLLFEFLLQETFYDSARTLLSDESRDTFCAGGFCDISSGGPVSWMKTFIPKHFHQFATLGFTYLILVHPLDLLNTILILRHSSALYAGETLQSFRGFFLNPLKDLGFVGPLITSVYALLLSALVSLGLISLGINSYQFFSLLSGVPFLALLMKYVEWRSIWNVGIVISVLEEKHGDIAIGVAAYLSKGSRRLGFLLMLVFFLWRLCLRSLCLYLVWGKRGTGTGVGATVAQVLGVCLGNLIKWVVLMVYYCYCKKRFLEKKIDVEHGKSDVCT